MPSLQPFYLKLPALQALRRVRRLVMQLAGGQNQDGPNHLPACSPTLADNVTVETTVTQRRRRSLLQLQLPNPVVTGGAHLRTGCDCGGAHPSSKGIGTFQDENQKYTSVTKSLKTNSTIEKQCKFQKKMGKFALSSMRDVYIRHENECSTQPQVSLIICVTRLASWSRRQRSVELCVVS
ncbi:hypothetical protein PoB_000981900 [Plakobranchus ocellatus]|uniref:Uncharacterized protein n=1 Tax=Plakobranchus ocellatus TaxID=259542 RepID=A0AAV3YMI1_9GAST|nr:hypothetical protein PoB_000981900 [Plakobranchus ocellatus]